MQKKKTRKKKPKLYITWDTETYKTNKKNIVVVKPYLIGWYCDNVFYHSFEPHTEFFKFLEDKTKYFKLVLIAHNANYDLPVIIKDYLSKFKGIKCTYKVSEEKRYISFRFSSIKPRISFTCLDTMLWNQHLKSLGNWLKVIGKKEKIENFYYDKWDLTRDDKNFYFTNSNGEKMESLISEELEYLQRDCEGVKEVYDYQEKSRYFLFDTVKTKPPKNMKKRAPAFAKALVDEKFGTNFFDNTFRAPIDRFDIYTSMIESSCGGFTCANKDYLWHESPEELIKSFDCNSDYPWIMFGGLPAYKMLKKPPKDKEYITFYVCNLTQCDWIDKYKFLSTKAFPSKWLTFPESVFILKEYYDVVKPAIVSDIEILDIRYMEKVKVLSNFIEDLYKEKLYIDEEPNSETKTFKKMNIKLILNSPYGKLCERTYFKDTFYNIKKLRFEEVDLDVKEFRTPMAGVYVAQMGRAVLIKNILREIDKGNTFLYSDTDSIKLVENVPVSFPIHPTKLGGWKNEGCGEDGLRGYTTFHSPGKVKKWLMYNRNLPDSLAVAFGGVTKIIKEIMLFGGYELTKHLFDPTKNILIRKGKTSGNTKNIYGQSIITDIDISSNGQKKDATHELYFDEIKEKFVLKKLKNSI